MAARSWGAVRPEVGWPCVMGKGYTLGRLARGRGASRVVAALCPWGAGRPGVRLAWWRRCVRGVRGGPGCLSRGGGRVFVECVWPGVGWDCAVGKGYAREARVGPGWGGPRVVGTGLA
ncbi:hypothetical protein Aut01nite_07170 [Actinoplanes utahensis]|nr:hypothetical protein Aut01nite_07170 [Actinoplanes utahensis]